MRFLSLSAAAALAGSAQAAILWDGRFNNYASSADIANWSWSNQVGPYQYYIHGPSAISSYINLSPAYKNPADSGSTQGARFTLDKTSFWNGQTMRRTELIPQTTAAINAGHVFYHFSIMKNATGEPMLTREHQICFFESHFTELKSGWISGESGTSDPLLRWDVGGTTKWSTTWTDGEWHNVAYEIDFSANTVAFWHSTGSAPLTLTVPAVSGSTSSNGEDWHLGVLELPVSGQPDNTENFFFSGVYIENGSITTNVAGPGAAAVGSSSSAGSPVTSAPATTLVTSSTSVAPVTTAVATGGTLPKYAQCGGSGWMGSGTCVAGSTCQAMGAYYSQCL